MKNLLSPALLSLFFTLPLTAQHLTFEPSSNGISRTVVRTALETSWGEIFLGLPDGLYRYDDKSDTWIEPSVDRVFVSLQEPIPGLLLGSTHLGIERSLDSGRTWSAVLRLPGNGSYVSDEEGVIYGVDLGGGYLHVSTDSGVTWRSDPLPHRLRDFPTMVTLGNRLLIPTQDSGIVASDDRGRTRFRIGEFDHAEELILTESGALVITVQPDLFDQTRTIYESIDSGRSWYLVDSMPSRTTLAPGAEATYYLAATYLTSTPDQSGHGLHRREVGSVDRTTIAQHSGIERLFALNGALLVNDNFRVVFLDESDTLRDITPERIDVSIEGLVTGSDGITWTLVPDSLVYGSSGQYTSNALYRSTNNGRDWQKVDDRFVGNALANHSFPGSPASLAVDPWNNLYVTRAELEWSLHPTGRYVTDPVFTSLVSSDGGSSWKKIEEDIMVATMEADGRGTIRVGNHFSFDSGTTWVSTDSLTMEYLGGSSRDTVTLLRILGDHHLLATLEKDDTSTDLLIDTRSTPPRTQPIDFTPILAFLHVADNTLLVADTVGIWRSTDGGATWVHASDKRNTLDFNLITPDAIWARLRIYNSGEATHIYSDDGGMSWQERYDEFLPGYNVTRHPSGIFYSVDRRSRPLYTRTGTFWRQVMIDGSLLRDGAYTIDSSGTFITATSHGLYRSTDISSVPTATEGKESKTLGLYLNRGILSLDDPANVRAVTVFSSDGRQRARFDRAGILGGQIDLSALTSGGYLVRIERTGDIGLQDIRVIVP